MICDESKEFIIQPIVDELMIKALFRAHNGCISASEYSFSLGGGVDYVMTAVDGGKNVGRAGGEEEKEIGVRR